MLNVVITEWDIMSTRKNVDWTKRRMGQNNGRKTWNGKKRQKDKTSNGQNDERT